MKYMGKTPDILSWQLKFWLSQNLLLQANSCAAGGTSNTELLMPVSDFKVNSRLKNTQRVFQWYPWNTLNENA